MTTDQTLDERLSEAQRVLRDGYNDVLSGAVAEARNLLTSQHDHEACIAEMTAKFEQALDQCLDRAEDAETALKVLEPYVPAKILTRLQAGLKEAQRERDEARAKRAM